MGKIDSYRLIALTGISVFVAVGAITLPSQVSAWSNAPSGYGSRINCLDYTVPQIEGSGCQGLPAQYYCVNSVNGAYYRDRGCQQNTSNRACGCGGGTAIAAAPPSGSGSTTLVAAVPPSGSGSTTLVAAGNSATPPTDYQ